MKLLSFEYGSDIHVGASIAEGVLDLTRALAITHPNVRDAHSLLAIIEAGIDIDSFGAESIAELRKSGRLTSLLIADPKYLPPITRPRKILALALNTREHIGETGQDFFEEPIVFAKYPSNMVGHDRDIELPPFPQRINEENEVCLVVGKDCRHILPSEAPNYIFGWTISNDVSARDRQRERSKMGQPYSYAKNFATFCPVGPWVVTRKELPNAANLKMSVRVNGKTTREGSTSSMIFDPYQILAYCSDYTPMEAGDIISLGTFAGEKLIQEGDVVELDVEHIGVLRNRVVAAKAPWRNFTPGAPTGPFVKER